MQQPPLLVQRFMLNLGQLGTADESSSDTWHSPRFSLSFQMSSNFLGNIGESLDHSQSEQVQDDSDYGHSGAIVEPEDRHGDRVAQEGRPSSMRRHELVVSLVPQSTERASERDDINLSASLSDTARCEVSGALRTDV